MQTNTDLPAHDVLSARLGRRPARVWIALLIGLFVVFAGAGTAVAIAALDHVDGFGEGY